jgi:anthranilate/para-aminobenzoate synthase component II
MIPHHQGGVVMAQEVLRKSKRPQLIKLAKGIITEQKLEIVKMQKYRERWYPTASATPIMWHAEMNHEMAMTPAHKQSMMMSMSFHNESCRFDRAGD